MEKHFNLGLSSGAEYVGVQIEMEGFAEDEIMIGIWEVLNDLLVDFLSMKEFKEMVCKRLDLKRDVLKSFNEEEI
ncbi:hypothetical protein [Bacillus cereus]|uniref:hypothetical protein n=1 Tax=Bacillus cereus TaxID=1396 RepID=UPI0034A0C1C9